MLDSTVRVYHRKCTIIIGSIITMSRNAWMTASLQYGSVHSLRFASPLDQLGLHPHGHDVRYSPTLDLIGTLAPLSVQSLIQVHLRMCSLATSTGPVAGPVLILYHDCLHLSCVAESIPSPPLLLLVRSRPTRVCAGPLLRNKNTK